VIEYLKASLSDTSSASDPRASVRSDAWVVRMVRCGGTAVLVAALLNLFQFHRASGLFWSWALACAWFNFLLANVTFGVTFCKRFTKHWRPVMFLILSALVTSDTVLGTLGGEPKLLFISLILLMVGTGSLLPWPIRIQVCFDLVCLVAWVTESAWVPSSDGLTAYKMVALTIAAALSLFCCYVRVRFVSEYNESERIILESEAALRQIFDANTDGITLIDFATRRIQDVNNHFLRISGFRREEVIGKTTDELDVWTEQASQKEFMRRIQTDGGVTNMEINFRSKDGRIIPCLLSSVIIVLRGRTCVMTLARDITELLQSREKLRESEEKFRMIFEASRDSILLNRVSDHKIVEFNDYSVRLSGYSREEALGRTPLELGLWAVPEQRAEFITTLEQRGYIDGYEISLRTSSGVEIPVLLSAVTVKLAGENCYLSMARDISHLRRAEEKIRDSEATQRRIFNASVDWMSIVDMSTGDYLDANESFLRATGYSREELIGSNFFKLGLWPDEGEWNQFTQALVSTGKITNHPATFRMKDGTLVPSLISAVQCELWGRVCCISSARDITELNLAQEKLRRSEETFRKLFDSSIDAITIVDMTTAEYVDVNPEFLRASGFTRDEIIGKSADSLNQWADPEQRQEFERVLLEKGEVRNMETDGRTKDGSVVTCLTSGVITEIAGRRCYLGMTRNISELKAAEQKLRKSEVMLRAIFDNSPDGITLLNMDTQTIAEVNPELTRVIGFSREEMIGKTFPDLVPMADVARHQDLIESLRSGRAVRNFEITFKTRYGKTWPALLSAALVMIEGRPHRLSVVRDITDLIAAREAALAASRAKSEFLSIMSHEIRTPMNAILGMADLMGESALNSEQRRYLDTILSNGNALLDLINSILDLAKVESGRLSLENVEFDLIELTEHAAETLAVRAHEKGLELAVRFAPGLATNLNGDPYRLRQILNNLIGNAVKFTKQGEVVVAVEPNPDPSVPGNLLFTVRDTGIGIAPNKIDSVFSIFTQADTSTTRKFGGSGLGLAIVQRLVVLMGGKVWVDSEVGKGSTFRFTVDLKAAVLSAGAPCAAEALDLRGLPVLLAEENATSRGIVAELLRRKGASIIEAASEAAALAALHAIHRERHHFGLLVIDCETLSIDGFPALRRICGAAHAPVILLTKSHGLANKLREMRAQGIEHYCIKPVKQRDLDNVVAQALAEHSPRRQLKPDRCPELLAPAAVAQKITDRPLRILLADDSPDNRLLIRAYTKKTAYVLTEVENGQIAVERFVDGSFDLVLMDIQMPVLDGYSAVRTIRQWEREHQQAHTPILALTASALEEDVRRAKEAGCDMHVSKPVKKSTLLDAIARAMEMSGESSSGKNVAGRSPIAIGATTGSEPLPATGPDFHI
jgi:PAS domain S-box-containing protein